MTQIIMLLSHSLLSSAVSFPPPSLYTFRPIGLHVMRATVDDVTMSHRKHHLCCASRSAEEN